MILARRDGLASRRGRGDGEAELAVNDFRPLSAGADSGRLPAAFSAGLEHRSRCFLSPAVRTFRQVRAGD